MKETPVGEVIVTAYVTKYAVSSGIQRVRGRYRPGDIRPMLVYRTTGSSYDQYAMHKDWHLTEEAALKDADARLRRKLASLAKSAKAIEDKLGKVETEDHTGGHP